MAILNGTVNILNPLETDEPDNINTLFIVRSCVIAVLVLGIVLNVVLIISVLRQKALRTSPTYILLLSLALSDMNLLFAGIFETADKLLRGLFDDISCKLMSYTIGVSGTTSQLHLVLFSIFRYWILTNPLWSRIHLTYKKTIFLCVAIWVVNLSSYSAAFLVAEMTSFNTTENKTIVICAYNKDYLNSIILLMLILCIASLLLIAFFHIAKTVKLRRLSQAVRSANPQGVRTISNRAVVAIIVSFILGWLPLLVFLVAVNVASEGAKFPESVITEVWQILEWLLFFNSVVDPVLYFFFSRSQCPCVK